MQRFTTIMQRFTTPMSCGILLTLACHACLAVFPARAELKSYYIAHDAREVYPSGTYAGLSNPNFRRLTLIEASPATDHFHGIGNWMLAGPADSPDVVQNNENRVPPVSHGALPAWIPLVPGGAGTLYEGKLVTAPSLDPYTDLNLRSVASLDGFAPGTLEHTYFNSSSKRWSQPLSPEALPALELLSLAPGLHVGDAAHLDLATMPGEVIPLGAPNAINFTPVFWMESGTSPGKYFAEFRLVDLGNGPGYTPYGASGKFGIHVEVVPEPSAFALGLAGGLALVALCSRRWLATFTGRCDQGEAGPNAAEA